MCGLTRLTERAYCGRLRWIVGVLPEPILSDNIAALHFDAENAKAWRNDEHVSFTFCTSYMATYVE
jgi:hypothetical protein